MTEALLHFIWQHRLFRQQDLVSTDDESIHIQHNGLLNRDGGADFCAARIQIGNTTWEGFVEIHVHEQDWYLHQHQHNPAYNNVVLHVFYFKGPRRAQNERGNAIPSLCLNGHIPPKHILQFERLQASKHAIPCQAFHRPFPALHFGLEIEKRSVQRLQRKAEHIIQQTGNWEQKALRLLARYMGSKVNNEALENLINRLDIPQFHRHTNSIYQKEAWLFGLARLLKENTHSPYANFLYKEFNYLRQTHNLQAMSATNWRLLRLRPNAFPYQRIAQLAALLHQQQQFLDTLLSIQDIVTAQHLLQAPINDYWKHHYQYDKAWQTPASAQLGKASINTIIINAIVPLQFAFGRFHHDDQRCEQAIDLLQLARFESNRITKQFAEWRPDKASAFESQGMIELYEQHCTKWKCLSCQMVQGLFKTPTIAQNK